MHNASLSSKRDAVVKYFTERQGLKCFKVNESEDLFGMNIRQWGDEDKIYRVKPTMSLSHALKYTKDDLEKVDVVLFMCETFVWREVYAIKREELEQHLDDNGNGVIDIDTTPCKNYFFYNMYKATQWLD